MNVRFFTLLYVAEGIVDQTLAGGVKKLSGEDRILVYLKNCHTLNHCLKINQLVGLTILTNKSEYLESLKKKYNLSFQVKEIAFDLDVPKNIGFYSAHFKIDAYRYLGTLANTYSFLLDNDVVCLKNMPMTMHELIDKHIAVHYAFPVCKVEKHDVNMMKYIEPSIITGEWSGGEFIGGDAVFYAELYQNIIGFADRYFKRVHEMFHQGDEMLTSIALEKMKLGGWKIIDGGMVNLIYRYYSVVENKTIESYKSWMVHLICDKHFLAGIDCESYQINSDFIVKYNRYFHTTMRVKKVYHALKRKLKRHA